MSAAPRRSRSAGGLAALLLALAGCAAVPTTVPEPAALAVPPQWQAPLPHAGSLADLSQWWQAQGDPVLVALIDAAQQASPDIASARSRIVQARATRTIAGAALLPRVDGSASATREPVDSMGPAGQPLGGVATTVQAGLQASWEIDLFGANRATRDAAQARLEGAQAEWHDARVAVAAEVAGQYSTLRHCERQLALSEADSGSRAETARLADLAGRAGFQSPADVALARASAAEARGRTTQQRALCDVAVKALVALSGWQEVDLRGKLAVASAPAEFFAPFSIASVPAQALRQRPDLLQAERAVAAASADLGSAQAQRYPRLTLNGAVGALYYRSSGISVSSGTWAIGPLALSVPVLDGGRSAAGVASAEARYAEAAALYQAQVRRAVREVEEALVNVQATAARNDDAQQASEGYRAAFAGTEARYRSGLASLPELEEARRNALAAETTRVGLQRERSAAWIALYRAVGGGWNRDATPTAQATP